MKTSFPLSFQRGRFQRLSLILAMLFSLGIAHAEVGTPCEEDLDCVPGEICLNHPEGDFCSRRCAGNPCPDGYFCDMSDRVPICDRAGPPPGEIGEGCENQCVETLFCAQDGEDRYCSRGCTGPGTCPVGMRCADGDMPICARLNGLPGYGEPCADGMCAEGLSCTEGVERILPYCTINCAEGMCPLGLVCGEGSLCRHEPVPLPNVNESCVPDDAQEPSLAGCAEGLRCTLFQVDSWCSRPCSRAEPCPEGMGCIREDPDLIEEGWCYPDQEDSVGLEPYPEDPVNPAPPGGPTGGAGGASDPPPQGGMGAAPSTDEAGGETNSCAQGVSAAAPLSGVLVILALVSLRRRRWA
ncbi:MAG: hypothetical protein VYD19_11330 [Myxococcota bacterium]|nr:hypothetical protein [Myxococcota bacterium]